MSQRQEPGTSGAPASDSPESPGPPPTTHAPAAAALSEAVARLTGRETPADRDDGDGGDDGTDHRRTPDPDADPDRPGAVAALRAVVSSLATGAKVGGRGAVVGGGFLADLLSATATRLPLRDKATLLEQHPGIGTEELADGLLRAATRVTGTIGGAAGGLAAVHWLVVPSLIAVPVELAAETLLVAAVELKLVAELHEIYDARPPGDLGERATAYLGAWTAQRGLRGEGQTVGLAARLTTAGAAALRKRINGRLARNLGSFLPFLAGAAVGARNNAAGTRKLGQRLRADLAVHPQRVPSQRIRRPDRGTTARTDEPHRQR